jgi:hypothetical protein
MPMWATLIAAGFFALVVLIVLLRADKTMANGALAVIALLAIGIAASLTVRGAAPTARPMEPIAEARMPPAARTAALPALSCLDGLAGESVEAACEHAVFASPDSAAAALSYASAQMSQIAADAGARHQTPDLQLLKRTIERDRFGLVAQVLSVRDRCGSAECSFFRLLSDPSRIKANIDEKLYDTLVARHTLAWNAAQMPGAAAAAANVPTGKPNTVDYPTSDSIPSVSIMTPEPSATPAPSAATPTPARRPAAAAKKPQPSSQQAAPQPSRPTAGAPTRIAPPPSNAGSIGRASVAPVPFVPPQQ